MGAVLKIRDDRSATALRMLARLRERFLSLRVLDDTEAVVTACCKAWNN